METYIYAFVSVGAVSLFSLVGIFTFGLREDILKKYTLVLVSLAVGALIGDAFLHLLPEAFEEASDLRIPSGLVIVGILLFFIFEKFLHWHHHEGDCESAHPLGKMILFSDGMHNFLDGLIIGASYLVSIEVGIATTLAVILHEIPQEIGDFGVLLHSGYTKTKALWYNFLSALLSVGGVIVIFIIGSEKFSSWIVPLAAGGFIYVALSDLVPELHRDKGSRGRYFFIQIASIGVGVLAMATLLLLE
jgi:zinc and cadmium transporter